MKHIPFAALPAAEREAVVAVLRQCGIATRQVCVSKLELPPTCAEAGLACLATVSAPGWGVTYDSGGAWIAQLQEDLAGLRAAR